MLLCVLANGNVLFPPFLLLILLLLNSNLLLRKNVFCYYLYFTVIVKDFIFCFIDKVL